jgi:histidinol-phosphate/aromatic aminotransferase/cobyric acid decarboxylase-like protein
MNSIPHYPARNRVIKNTHRALVLSFIAIYAGSASAAQYTCQLFLPPNQTVIQTTTVFNGSSTSDAIRRATTIFDLQGLIPPNAPHLVLCEL